MIDDMKSFKLQVDKLNMWLFSQIQGFLIESLQVLRAIPRSCSSMKNVMKNCIILMIIIIMILMMILVLWD